MGATASAAQANESPGSVATQETIGLKNGAPSGSTPEVSDPTGLSRPAQPPATSPPPPATATSALGPPEQALGFKPAANNLAPASSDSDVRLVLDRRLRQRTTRPNRPPSPSEMCMMSERRSSRPLDAMLRANLRLGLGSPRMMRPAPRPRLRSRTNRIRMERPPILKRRHFLASQRHCSLLPLIETPVRLPSPSIVPRNSVGRGVVLAEHADRDGSNLKHAIGNMFGTGTAAGD